MVPELPPVFQPDFDDALPAGHRLRERVVAAQLDQAAQLQDLSLAHTLLVVRGLEAHGAVGQHHGAQMLHADVGHGAVVRGVRAQMRDAHGEPLDLPGADAVRADQFQQRIERGLDRRADRPALDVGVHDLVALAQVARELFRVGRVPVGDEEVALARKNVLDAGEAMRDHGRRLHAVARGHAAEVEGLLDVRLVPHPAGDAGSLLRRVGKQMPHAALIQFREGARSRSCAERRPEAVRRMARGAELDRVQRLRQPAADVVAERDRAKERRAAGALAFRHGERRSDDPAARVRLRGRMRIVGLVGVAEHAVRERRIDRACHDAAAHDRGFFRPA